jgi:hypothetical protein
MSLGGKKKCCHTRNLTHIKEETISIRGAHGEATCGMMTISPAFWGFMVESSIATQKE